MPPSKFTGPCDEPWLLDATESGLHCSGLVCTFTDTSTDDGSVTGWSWDFGDNVGSSSDQRPTYTYAVEGSYTVALTATDNDGSTGTSPQTVTVTPAP
jgi:serine protease